MISSTHKETGEFLPTGCLAALRRQTHQAICLRRRAAMTPTSPTPASIMP